MVVPFDPAISLLTINLKEMIWHPNKGACVPKEDFCDIGNSLSVQQEMVKLECGSVTYIMVYCAAINIMTWKDV